MGGRRARSGGLRGRAAALVVVLLAAAGCAIPPGPGPGQAREPSPPPIGSEIPLPVLDGSRSPAVDPGVLRDSLGGLLADPALGPAPGIVVLDAATGRTLLQERAAAAVTPASSLKIATGLAALVALGPQHRLSTAVVREESGGIVLLGGGDPTLGTVARDGVAEEPALLADLAEQTAAALLAEGATEVELRYDASLFAGPALSPDWDPGFVGLGIVSPVSALTLDPAAEQVDADDLDADPAAAAASWFAQRLGALGVSAALAGPGPAPSSGQPMATVQSPPMAALVDRMLDISDNDVAEALFRLAAIGRGLPGTFEGGSRAVAETLEELQVPADGLVVRDGSGLSRQNRIAPSTLAAALRIAADPGSGVLQEDGPGQGPDLGAVTWLPPGLPVAGLTGSLADRYTGAATDDGAGRVRAKTGTLTGVSSLAGLVATEQQRPLVFAILGDGTANTLAARTALDRIAAGLAACGCQAPAS